MFVTRFGSAWRSLFLAGLLGSGVLAPAMGSAQAAAATAAGAAPTGTVVTEVVRRSAVRLGGPPHPTIALEGSLGYWGPPAHRYGGNSSLVPRLQTRVQMLDGPIQPYAGVGGSVAARLHSSSHDGFETTFAATAGVGVRVRVPERGLNMGVEPRVRWNGLRLRNGRTELVAALGWRF